MSNVSLEALTEESFDSRTSEGSVVVEFGAAWCMPCRMMEPVLHQLAESYSGRVRVMTVNTDQQPGLASRFGVNTVPTVLVLNRGELTRRFVGLTTFERLASAIEESLPASENATGT